MLKRVCITFILSFWLAIILNFMLESFFPVSDTELSILSRLEVKELSILSKLDTYAELQEDLANTYAEFKEDQTNLIVDKLDTTIDTLRRINNTGE